MEIVTKLCRECNTEKPLEKMWGTSKNGVKYRTNICNLCKNRQKRYRKKYRMKISDYDRMLLEQDGKCRVCKRPDNTKSNTSYFDVDHDHSTGKVRGLLCHSCNKALGFFNDNIELLKEAINYLNSNK